MIQTDTLTNRYITHFRKCLKRRYSISVILSDQGVVFFHVSVSVSTRFRFLTFCLLNYMYHTLTQMLCPIYIIIYCITFISVWDIQSVVGYLSKCSFSFLVKLNVENIHFFFIIYIIIYIMDIVFFCLLGTSLLFVVNSSFILKKFCWIFCIMLRKIDTSKLKIVTFLWIFFSMFSSHLGK